MFAVTKGCLPNLQTLEAVDDMKLSKYSLMIMYFPVGPREQRLKSICGHNHDTASQSFALPTNQFEKMCVTTYDINSTSEVESKI